MKSGLCLLFWFLAVGGAAAVDAPVPAATSSANAPAPTAKSPDLTNNFLVERGFRVELLATEPLVQSPIAMAFDENGRLFVLERDDKPGNAGAPMGRVRVLEDTDGNGRFDGSAIYASGLNNPTALICYNNGVFVGAAGEILYLKDTAFNGNADVRREIYKSFGDATNGAAGQVTITGFAWGLDDRIHVTTAGEGGDVISSSIPGVSVVLHGGDFAFEPRTFALTGESGTASAGMCFDNRGRVIVANHGRPLQAVMYEARYAARNPYVQMPYPLASLLDPASAAKNHLSADSLALDRGGVFPPDYAGDLFVADSSRGIIHRYKLRQNGIELSAGNVFNPVGTEFLTAKGNSFQIAQILEGPDGALYFAGTTRPPLSAAKTNPTNLSAFVRSGVYRIVPVNFKQPKPPQMTRATSEQLVLLLRHSNGWLRDTAQRLLFERQDRSSIAPLIRLLMDTQSPPLARMHALHALDGLSVTANGTTSSALMQPHILKGLTDIDDRVREHAVLLSEKSITSGSVPDSFWGQFRGMAGDASPQVRYQLAFTLGQTRHPDRGQLLTQILLAGPNDRWMQAAVASSLDDGAGVMFDSLVNDRQFLGVSNSGAFLNQVIGIIGAKSDPREVALALNDLPKFSDSWMAFSLARALDNGLGRANNSLAVADAHDTLQPLYTRAVTAALDNNSDDLTRIQAVRLLDGTALVNASVALSFMQEWPVLRPRLRREIVINLLSRPQNTPLLLQSVSQGIVQRADLSSTQIRYVRAIRDSAIQPVAMSLFGNAPDNAPRKGAVDRFIPSLQLTGQPEHGREIFLARCADCHQLAGEGNPVGLNLAGSAAAGRQQLLANIIDPNRQPLPENPATLVQTRTGEVLLGFIVADTSKCITVCDLTGSERVIGHSNIQSTENLGFSAMPDGLENGLSQQDMADLIDYISGNR